MSVLHLPVTSDVLLLYPGESLKDQIDVWTLRHPDRQVVTSFVRSLPEIRRLLRYAGASLVDATEDPAQATDAFLQAVARLGARAVTMYSETMHEGLELFARMQGSLFLAGPLFDEQWEDLFERLLRARAPMRDWPAPVRQRPLLLHLLDRASRRSGRFSNHFRSGFDWRSADFN